jgi:diaminohydroxyphosphoribosylaminopyrimidine deaminase/5-amino-6-(5-phosphoribosylamino)uracil reductase
VLKKLYQLKILSVLVEGGAKLLQSLIDAGYWDEARVIVNEQLIIGEGVDGSIIERSTAFKIKNYYSDSINYYKPCR